MDSNNKIVANNKTQVIMTIMIEGGGRKGDGFDDTIIQSAHKLEDSK